MRGRSRPPSIQSQGGFPSWVPWLQSQSLSYQLPPASPDALFMAHYLPPAVAQMPPARAVTSLRPLERTKGSSLSLSPSLLPLLLFCSLFGSQQAPGVWHSWSPLPTQESSFLFAQPVNAFT